MLQLTRAARVISIGVGAHMEYILNNKPGEIDYSPYRAYVESIREQLLPHVYAFASDIRYFDLESHSSLQDSWLESFTVREVATGERQEIRRMEIAIVLLGPFHDLRIHLHYTGVTRYSLVAPPRYGHSRYDHTAHGDLFTHEIRLGHEGLLVHELLFERDATFLIECSDIRHSEETIKRDT
jgi:hypothetical protein